MKKITSFIVLITCLITMGYAQNKSIEKLWETTQDIHVPESVLYDESTDKLYVSMIGKDGTDKGEIAILNTDGTVQNAHWVTGLNAPKGLAIHKGLLYIADVTKVIVVRSEEHTSELQSRENLVCRLLLEKKKIEPTI